MQVHPFIIIEIILSTCNKTMSSEKKTDIPVAKQDGGYEQMRAMMSIISGDNNRASTSASALESIKLIGQLDKMYPDSDTSSLAKVYQYEKQYLQAGIDAITSNPQLGDKFGRGLEGATIVASFMKQVNSEEMAKDQVRAFLPQTGVSGSSASVSAFYKTRADAMKKVFNP
jgi:hypothetical protein